MCLRRKEGTSVAGGEQARGKRSGARGHEVRESPGGGQTGLGGRMRTSASRPGT